jgi:hypothetical protein
MTEEILSIVIWINTYIRQRREEQQHVHVRKCRRNASGIWLRDPGVRIILRVGCKLTPAYYARHVIKCTLVKVWDGTHEETQNVPAIGSYNHTTGVSAPLEHRACNLQEKYRS